MEGGMRREADAGKQRGDTEELAGPSAILNQERRSFFIFYSPNMWGLNVIPMTKKI
jgi:hypothetical protein